MAVFRLVPLWTLSALLLVADVARSRGVVSLPMCRVPVADRYRNYYMAASGAKSHWDGVFVCMKYGDISGSSSGSLLAMRCEVGRGGTPILVLDPTGISECQRQIEASVNEVDESNLACDLLEAAGPDEMNTEVYSLEGMKLTGQNNTGNDAVLDKLYVTHLSIVCTETYGTKTVAATPRLCRGGSLSAYMPGSELRPRTEHSCANVDMSALGF